MRRPSGLAPILLAALAVPTPAGEPAPAVSPASPPAAQAVNEYGKPLQGPWQNPDFKSAALFDGESCVLMQNGRTIVARVLKYEAGKVTLRVNGLKLVLEVAVRGDVLTLTAVQGRNRGEAQELRRGDKVPPELLVRPLVLGAPAELSPERSKEIQVELARRQAEDQSVRKHVTRRQEMAKVDADNTAWIRRTVAEVGWIDSARFGGEAAEAAFLLVQHSGDLPLMLAALPAIEKDLRAEKDRDARRERNQAYAMLFDRTQLMSGNRQRYGTQVGPKPNGDLAVLPLEDRARVDELRQQVSLPPMAEYLSSFRAMNKGAGVGYMEDD